MVARMVVVLLRKSEVRRTPNTVPILLVPRVPASPPPLLACIKTTRTRRMLTRISISINKENISAPAIDVRRKNPNLVGVASKYTQQWNEMQAVFFVDPSPRIWLSRATKWRFN